MSEHQIHEFVAIDKPLTKQEMKALRAISTRAEITSTRFWNEYHWGDLKADPTELLARYFDVYVYTASWGEHRVSFRLPADRVDIAALRPYFAARRDTLKKRGAYYILELFNADDDHDPDMDAETGDTAALVSLRAGLLQGDLRVPYMVWLLAVQDGFVPDGTLEPAVPSGLLPLSAPLAALADFLRVDEDLLQAATEGLPTVKHDDEALQSWIAGLAQEDKDAWLNRAVEHPDLPLGAELLAAFRVAHLPAKAGTRTAGQIRARAEALAEIGEREAQAEEAREREHLEAQRDKRLAALVRAGARSWTKLEGLVESRKYDEAVALAVDLHEAAVRSQGAVGFQASLAALKQRQASRRGFFTALRRQPELRPESEGLGWAR